MQCAARVLRECLRLQELRVAPAGTRPALPRALVLHTKPSHAPTRSFGLLLARLMLTQIVGWTAALLLLVTMVRQVWSQWSSGAVGGVSRWLFVGQCAASAAFTWYSVLVDNLVFVVTNALMLVNAITGLCIDRRNRRRADAGGADRAHAR
jgi:MtN3 and saliva related transmembrane protein